MCPAKLGLEQLTEVSRVSSIPFTYICTPKYPVLAQYYSQHFYQSPSFRDFPVWYSTVSNPFGVRRANFPGIINLMVATAPLLKTLPHAVLLTSLMASLVNLHRYKDTAEFQEKLLCMSPHVAGLLLGEWHFDALGAPCSQTGSPPMPRLLCRLLENSDIQAWTVLFLFLRLPGGCVHPFLYPENREWREKYAI